MLRSRFLGRPSWTNHRGRGTPPGWRTAKATLAAVLAYELARRLLPGGPLPLLAPLTALLVAQITVVETLKSGLERVGSVVAGVLIAVVLSKVVGLTWWGLGTVIFASLIAGQLLRLGDQRLEVPISAVPVLAVTGQTQVAAQGRILEGTRLLVDARTDPELRHIQGSLLANADRLLHEIDLERGADARRVRRR
ncbi:MAG TPA: aromatic acid exporter family protein [Actinomycetes bacterium]|nr:aromatic acid exporter family protein [Actinomycetes bacterium]